MYKYLVLLILFFSCAPEKEATKNTYRTVILNPTKDFKEDTIVVVSMDYIEENLLRNIQGFDYPKLDVESTTDNSISLKNDAVKLFIESAPFDTLEHKIEYKDGYIRSINGKELWGTDGTLPKEQIDRINFTNSTKVYTIDKKHFNNLFNPNLDCPKIDGLYCYTEAFHAKDKNEIILIMSNSDAAGSYTAIFVMDEETGNIKRKVVGNGLTISGMD